MKKGDKVIIKDNLDYHMKRLGYDNKLINDFVNRFVGTKQTVYDIWKDDNETYVTIDMCVEIPIECCEVIKEHTV